jgi:hypothetical protein
VLKESQLANYQIFISHVIKMKKNGHKINKLEAISAQD